MKVQKSNENKTNYLKVASTTPTINNGNKNNNNDNEKGNNKSNSNNKSRNNNKPPCRNEFTGGCRNEWCTYSHRSDWGRMKTIPIPRCPEYYYYGTCRFGSDCNLTHSRPNWMSYNVIEHQQCQTEGRNHRRELIKQQIKSAKRIN